MSVNNRFLFMFLVFTAILLPLYGCGGGESGGEAGTPPVSQPFTPPASQPSITEYSPAPGSTSSCSAPSLLTRYEEEVVFVDGGGNNFGSYTYCFLSSGQGTRSDGDFIAIASCGSLHLPVTQEHLDIGGAVSSANTARIIGVARGWDDSRKTYEAFLPSSGTIRLTSGRSVLRIENITAESYATPLWFEGSCYSLPSGMESLRSAVLAENTDSDETPLPETFSAIREFFSNYDPDNSDVDEDLDGLDTDLGRVETDGSEIEE